MSDPTKTIRSTIVRQPGWFTEQHIEEARQEAQREAYAKVRAAVESLPYVGYNAAQTAEAVSRPAVLAAIDTLMGDDDGC